MAFGRPADEAKANRTITVEMRDSNEFAPNEIIVRQGDIVRFVALNTGVEMHEMVLGTMDDLKAHAAMMKQQRGMHHDHEPHIVHVAPGNSGVLTWEFTRAGDFYYGCLVDEHFERGMVGRVRVLAASGTQEHAAHHEHAAAAGAYGPYSMSRESSGTAWQPDAAPHEGIVAAFGEWSTMTHGFVNLTYDNQGGPRGETKTFSTSMLMVMAQRPAGDGTFGLRGMVSADRADGKARLSAAAADRRDAPTASRSSIASIRTTCSWSSRRSYSHRLGERGSVFSLCRPPGRAGARAAGLHASLLRRGQPGGADLASLARLDAHHLRRRHPGLCPRPVEDRRLDLPRPRARREPLPT